MNVRFPLQGARGYINIGKLVASFGVNGDLILHHHLGKKTSLKGLEAIFVEMVKDEMLPYFIQSAKIKSEEEIYLKLEGIDTKESAQQLRQKEIWLPEEDFHKYAAKTSTLSLLGFHIINEGADIGPILEIIEHPQQMLARIDLDGKEALIPLHEESLQKIDKKKKQVHVVLPDGLLDVYR
ncbi:MAG TPA: ribosome maturation factor RimM [Chitinophagaceae bacterium]|nr:ribosome maturation factor RimM [Chitinophagaceae bacterium]